jgi:hypothetical protein
MFELWQTPPSLDAQALKDHFQRLNLQGRQWRLLFMFKVARGVGNYESGERRHARGIFTQLINSLTPQEAGIMVSEYAMRIEPCSQVKDAKRVHFVLAQRARGTVIAEGRSLSGK